MLGLNQANVIFLVLTVSSVTADGDFLYISKTRNASVDIVCESAKKEENLFAFSLTRKLLQSRQVLYFRKGSKAFINNSDDKDRITAQDKLDNHTVHLRISNLQGQDTDVYDCEFHYGDPPFDISVPGKMKFFIYVEDFSHEPCNCSSYLPLIYVISGAACLLGVMMVTFATIYCCKRPKRKPPQPMVPVYEEMTGVQPAKEKATKLQETNNFLLSKENYYEKPKSRQFPE
ncbi:cd7 antigen-like isoform X1 [Misgurnus anguillicaudatus]|uniref:cd7 antigen-like isoform X1 n=1 Tax=Misgurnus anguillicaudatus TaxID=75329 RepID=UPI003CCF7E0D